MTSVASSLPSALSSLRKPSLYSRPHPPDYTVVDSQNQQEQQDLHVPKKYSGGGYSVPVQNYAHLISSIHQVDHQVEYEANIDEELMQAQKQIKQLQKQCQLFENLINDMVTQQAEIQVQLNTRMRKRNNQISQCSSVKPCPLHNPLSQLNSMSLKPSRQSSQFREYQSTNYNTHSHTYINTPQISRNEPLSQISQNKSKTVDISNYLSKVTVKTRPTSRRKMTKPKPTKKENVKGKSCPKKHFKRVV